MYRKFLITVCIAAAASLGGPAIAQTMVKEVEVDVDLDAVENAKAAAHWSEIASDLENAIVARLTDRLVGENEEGAKIAVDIDEVSLASSWDSAVGAADSKLAGTVNVSHESDNTAFDSYELTVTFEQAGPFFLPGTDFTAITTDSQEYYDAMIAAFADHLVSRIE
ncbi:hypothetical protein OEW28_08625 [Defluviimonas sp. WL0002]|uniref:SRPBCC family protein n=1 Tax=Albidovulum marisflavi TaxID=2984159 RepID=A0ABT2ZC74_9RHOB|nr:hypothetical protein [Defluviimonas sp. WL0002]MCV2868691.1 hypothetical protein [Defluviimonas sp. WL0002]